MPKKERVRVVVLGSVDMGCMPLLVVWKYDMMSIFYRLFVIEFKLALLNKYEDDWTFDLNIITYEFASFSFIPE